MNMNISIICHNLLFVCVCILQVWQMFLVQVAAHRISMLTIWTFQPVSLIITLKRVRFICTSFQFIISRTFYYCFYALKFLLFDMCLVSNTNNTHFLLFLLIQHSFQLKNYINIYVCNAIFLILFLKCDSIDVIAFV